MHLLSHAGGEIQLAQACEGLSVIYWGLTVLAALKLKLGIRMPIFASRRPVCRLCMCVLCTGEACVACVTFAV